MTGTTDPVTRRIAAADREATLEQRESRWVLTMTWLLAHPPARVWRMLVEPERLRRWSPVVPDRPLDSTGPATAREAPYGEGHDATVLVCDPPRELVHRWGADALRWTLERTGDGTRLVLEHTFAERSGAGSYGAGWHICLAVLGAVLDGEAVERVTGPRAHDYDWSGLRDSYESDLGLA
jgi:uncharacterized protein YndB with AHSA1/START domain